jgi:hypothetical protein
VKETRVGKTAGYLTTNSLPPAGKLVRNTAILNIDMRNLDILSAGYGFVRDCFMGNATAWSHKKGKWSCGIYFLSLSHYWDKMELPE